MPNTSDSKIAWRGKFAPFTISNIRYGIELFFLPVCCVYLWARYGRMLAQAYFVKVLRK